ncbi:threonine synthase [Brevibacillus fluminis]|uniref:Threonine synthase n=1 Tax=Brevibacillus fluminis TaxID=511487 RepID=A0A3M8DWC9_9BACL|nr:threonine synthase [Brevibacillus fluminis]RNB91819.1 threonine synthase [Brevibacillus fluminis]
MKFVCIDCQKEMPASTNTFTCKCGGLLEVVHDFSRIDSEQLKHVFTQRLSLRTTPFASGVWRYKELIFPELEDRFITTKYEGNTGLYTPVKLQEYTGIQQLYVKAQSENPSGSFKDNGMTVAVSHGRSLGFSRFACSSTGNTSSSLAMYAALAGGESYVYVPQNRISQNKVLQTLAYGANVIRFDGTYDDGIRFLRDHAEELGLYVCNSVNPMRIEGQKSIIYEIAQTLEWKLPDWIVVPGGALSNATALGKGLHDLYTLGFIDKLPRVAIVQAVGASPFHRMVVQKLDALEPELSPQTVASALNIGNPPSWKKALRMIEATNGVTIAVSDVEILDAKAMVDQSGIGCEPASAATIAGLRALIESNVIDKEESALCILTGNMLKDTDTLYQYHLGETPGRFQRTIQNSTLNPSST